jgi:hypothetical protein
MYRDDIAPDPGSLPRELRREQYGNRSFLRSGRRREGRTGQKRDRLPARQFVAGWGVRLGQYHLARSRPGWRTETARLHYRRGDPAVLLSGHQPDLQGRPPDSAPVNGPSLVQLADGRRMITTVVGIILVAAGTILRFAVPATFTRGLDVHVAGVIVMLAGIVGLLLSLLVWGPLNRRRNHSGDHGWGTPLLARQRGVHHDQPPARGQPPQ